MPDQSGREEAVETHDVVIAGGGPTGLTLAGELALAGVDVAIVERRETQDLAGSRAGGLHARTIETLDQRGIADRFLSEGKTTGVGFFAAIPLDMRDLPTRHNYVLALWQNHVERILAGWVAELGVPILRGHEVTGFAQDESGVDVEVSGSRVVRAKYLVACDGGRSAVRRKAGIDFPGWDPSISYLIAEAEMAGDPPFGVRRDEKGTYAIGKLEEGKRVRVVVREEEVRKGDAPSLAELREALVALYGSDHGLHRVTWLSRFSDTTRQAAAYRAGRVLVAGDAAHIHSPIGGQGLHLGVQDAVNLGWKLGQVVRGTAPDSLLDTYHSERHPVAARVLRTTMAGTALSRGDVRVDALRETMTELLGLDEPRKRYAAMIAGLDVHYDLGGGHPLVGRRMPDLEVVTASRAQRVFSFLHAARPVLLNFGARDALGIAPWADRVRRFDATYAGVWELPVVGVVAPPAAVLIRPDGHVAWVGTAAVQAARRHASPSSSSDSDAGLPEALTKWFGPPAAAAS